MCLIALLSVAIAFVFQVLGYVGTCTQGANGPFLAGALVGFPLLVLSAGLLTANAVRNLRHPIRNGSVINGTASIGVTLMTVWMVVRNSAVARDTLWLGTGPCWPDHTPVGLFNGPDMAVGVVYFVMPALIAPLAMFSFWTDLPTRRFDSA